MYSKIDLRQAGIYKKPFEGCPFLFSESVGCAHIKASYKVSDINYLCVCDNDMSAAQDKKPKRMNIIDFMRDRKLQDNYHAARLQHSIAGIEGWEYV